MTATHDPTGQASAYLDGPAWTRGPQLVYDRLAARALGRLPDDLGGLTAIDVGAGTGGATRELRRRGARVIAADLSVSMLTELRRQTDGQVPAFVADICSLPVPAESYDVAVAAYVINHLDDPAAGMRELARVTRASGRVIATTFGADDHPIKQAVDEVLVRFGFVHPEWYLELKHRLMPLIATTAALTTVGVNGGLTEVTVDTVDVDLGDLPVDAAIGYRLGLAHIAPFVRQLDPATRTDLETQVLDVVRDLPPLRLPMLVLSGRPSSP